MPWPLRNQVTGASSGVGRDLAFQVGEPGAMAPTGGHAAPEAVRSGQFRSVWTAVGGLSMHARVSTVAGVHGAPPVVLVAGLGLSSRVMLPIGEALAGSHPVYAVDLPGYGLSSKPKEVLTLRQLAGALDAWMGAVGLDRAIVVGNSVGSQIAVELAVQNPALVGWLVLAGPTMDPPARNPIVSTVRWAKELPMEFPMYGTMMRDYWDCGLRRFLGLMRHAKQDEIEDKLPRLRMPVLVIRGGRDPMVSQEWAEHTARLAPGGRLTIIPKAAHNLTFLAPQATADVVTGWATAQI